MRSLKFGDLNLNDEFFYQPPRSSRRKYVKTGQQVALCHKDEVVYFFKRSAEVEIRERAV